MPYIGKSPQFGVRSRFYYTQSSAGGTSVSGTDDNGKTLKFSDGEFVDVMLNGVTLVAGTDYNTSTANTISGLAALSNGDVVEVVVYDTFSVSDTVSAKDGGTFSGNVAMGGTLSVTGTSTLTGAVTSTNGIYLGGTASTNLLNNYVNDGTWSPYYSDINGNAIFNETPAIQEGNNQRIGDFVTVNGYLKNATSVTTTGNYSATAATYIGGLPFAVPAGNAYFYAGIVSYQVDIAGTYDNGGAGIPMSLISEAGYSVLRLHYALVRTMVQTRNDFFSNDTALIFQCTYKVA